MKQPSNLPPGTTDRMIEETNYTPPPSSCERCGKLGFEFCLCARRGPRTKASKGQRRNCKITITLPPKTHDRLIDIQGDTKMSHLINELVLEALEARKGEENER